MLRYSVHQLGLPGTTFEEDVALLRELGVPAIGISRPKLLACGLERAVRLLGDAGLAVSVHLGAGGYLLEQPETWPAVHDVVRAALDEAVALGACGLLVNSGPAGSLDYDQAEARFRDILEVIVPEAEQRAMPLVFEPNHALRVDLGYVHSLHDGLDLADEVDSPWFTVVAEVNNCWIERHLYRDIAQRSHRIGVVQIDDFAAGTLCTPHRVPLGDGVIPLPRIISAFLSAGYGGFFEIEVLGPAVDAMGGRVSTQRSLDYLKTLDG